MFTSFSLSAFSQTNTNALPALAPPYGELPPTFWEQHGATILIGGLLLVALAGLLAWNLLHPRPPVLPQPDVLAREALTRLLGQTEDGNHLSEISKVLRRYLVVVFVLPPGETTTAEFYAALAGNEKIGPELALAISDFLRECDERKFSPAVRSSAFTRSGPPEGGTPNPLPPLNAAARALEIVESVEKRREKSGPQNGAGQND